VNPEAIVAAAVSDLVTVVEACGAVIITVGALWAFVSLILIAARTRQSVAFASVRLTLGRTLALGLEFQLTADVLRTAVSPTFREIGQLAAIAAIRTALNYFLARELAQERRQVAEQASRRQVDQRPITSPPSGWQPWRA
jgi:uncharacterized membrane protein